MRNRKAQEHAAIAYAACLANAWAIIAKMDHVKDTTRKWTRRILDMQDDGDGKTIQLCVRGMVCGMFESRVSTYFRIMEVLEDYGGCTVAFKARTCDSHLANIKDTWHAVGGYQAGGCYTEELPRYMGKRIEKVFGLIEDDKLITVDKEGKQ